MSLQWPPCHENEAFIWVIFNLFQRCESRCTALSPRCWIQFNAHTREKTYCKDTATRCFVESCRKTWWHGSGAGDLTRKTRHLDCPWFNRPSDEPKQLTTFIHTPCWPSRQEFYWDLISRSWVIRIMALGQWECHHPQDLFRANVYETPILFQTIFFTIV